MGKARKAVRVVMLAGCAVYLLVFGVTMALGPFSWTPDWLGSHGEPFLVLALGFYAGYEALSTGLHLG